MLACAPPEVLGKLVELVYPATTTRIALHELHIPPLRERRHEIPQLTALLWRQVTGGSCAPLGSPEVELLAAYHFPGNVRELRGILERLWLRSRRASRHSRIEILGDILQRGASPPSVQGCQSLLAQRCLRQMIEAGASFWDAVHRPYLRRDINRAELYEVLRAGLELSAGSWKRLVPIFRVGDVNYKKFLDFVRKQGFTLDRRGGGTVASRPLLEGAANPVLAPPAR